jgi:hypothetical protein
MKLKNLMFIVAFIASTQLATLQAAEPKKGTAAEASKDAPKKTAPKAETDTYPFYGKVVAVTSRTLTIVRSDAPEAEQSKYNLNASVEYVDGEKPATFESVKVGSWVGGSLKKNSGDGNDTVLKLNVGVKQKAAAKKKATTKKTEAKPESKKKTD